MNDIPQSCSLSAPELAERRRLFAALPLEGEEAAGGATLLRYRDEPGVRDALRELIRLESECCPGVDFRLTSDERGLVLRIAA